MVMIQEFQGGRGLEKSVLMITQSPVNSETIVTAKAYHRRARVCYRLNAYKSELDGHLLWILNSDTAPVYWMVGVVWSCSDPDLNSLTAVTAPHSYAKPSGTESSTGCYSEGKGVLCE